MNPKLTLPRDPGELKMVWKIPLYNTLWPMLTNPMYAGACAFGKTQARNKMVDGRAHKTIQHRKPRPEWTVLIREHHPGYLSWEQFEHNQQLIASNVHMKSRMESKAGRGDSASGIISHQTYYLASRKGIPHTWRSFREDVAT